MADFTMEDTQNSAPGQPSVHEASKLPSNSRRQDTQSVTKRYGLQISPSDQQSLVRILQHSTDMRLVSKQS